MVAWDLENWAFPPSLVLYHYIDDMSSCDVLCFLPQATTPLQEHLKAQGWEADTNKVQRRRQSVKLLGVTWSGKTKVMPEAVLIKHRCIPCPDM